MVGHFQNSKDKIFRHGGIIEIAIFTSSQCDQEQVSIKIIECKRVGGL